LARKRRFPTLPGNRSRKTSHRSNEQRKGSSQFTVLGPTRGGDEFSEDAGSFGKKQRPKTEQESWVVRILDRTGKCDSRLAKRNGDQETGADNCQTAPPKWGFHMEGRAPESKRRALTWKCNMRAEPVPFRRQTGKGGGVVQPRPEKRGGTSDRQNPGGV